MQKLYRLKYINEDRPLNKFKFKYITILAFFADFDFFFAHKHIPANRSV